MVYATVGHCGSKIEVTWCISCTFATQCSYMLVSLQNLLEIDLSHIQTLLKNIYKYLRAPRKKLKNHPNIVQLVNIVRSKSQAVYLVFEFLEFDLYRVLRKESIIFDK